MTNDKYVLKTIAYSAPELLDDGSKVHTLYIYSFDVLANENLAVIKLINTTACKGMEKQI